MLNLRHIGKFYLSQTIGGFLVLVGILLISLASTGAFYLMVMKTVHHGYLVGLLLFVWFTSFMVSSVFLGLFDEAILATLQCVAIDMDLN